MAGVPGEPQPTSEARIGWRARLWFSRPELDEHRGTRLTPPAPEKARSRALRLTAHFATDVTPLRDYRDYRLIWSGNLISSAGRQMTVVALPFQAFSMTQSTLVGGLISMVQLVPMLVMALAGGALADALDRRRLLLTTNLLLAGCATSLAVSTAVGLISLPQLFVTAALMSGIAAIDHPTRTALLPRLVPLPKLASALSLNAIGQQMTLIVGPAVAGILISVFGIAPCYAIDAITFGAAITAVLLLAPQPRPTGRREPILRAMAEGLIFTWKQRILRSAYTLDSMAVIFGLRRSLYAVLGSVVYAAGPAGVGALYSAMACGSLFSAGTSGWIGRTRRQGVIVLVMVGVWGLATLGLGLAPTLWLAVLAVAICGAADGYSIIARQTMVQTVTPDHLRGRTASISSMAAGGSNYLGDLEGGAVAEVTSPAFAIVSGAVVVLVAVVGFAFGAPELRKYRSRHVVDDRVP